MMNKLQAELPVHLYYHNFEHTQLVLKAALHIAKYENIDHHSKELLKSGAVMHDVGFLWDEHNHEEAGANYATDILPEFGYNAKEIEQVQALILATRITDKIAHTQLEKILCDADLDYLGTDHFFEKGHLLYKEFLHFGIVQNEKEWNNLQVKFLTSHRYYTNFAIKYRQAKKLKNLEKVKQKLRA